MKYVCHSLSFIFICYVLNALTFMSFDYFGTDIFGYKTLQLPLYLSKLIMDDSI